MIRDGSHMCITVSDVCISFSLFIHPHVHGGKSKGTTCVVDRDVTAYMVVDRVLRFPTE